MFFILVCVQPVSGAEHLKNVSNNSMSRKEWAERLTLTPRPSTHEHRKLHSGNEIENDPV